MLLTRSWIMYKQMITMIEQKQKEDKIGKWNQNDNLREKNTEISRKNRKRGQIDVNRTKKRRITEKKQKRRLKLDGKTKTDWQFKRKEYRNIMKDLEEMEKLMFTKSRKQF